MMIKKAIQVAIFLGVIFLIGGCATKDHSSQETPAENNTETDAAQQSEDQDDNKQEPQRNEEENASQPEQQDDKDLTQEEIMEAIKEQIDTDLTIVLPDSIPLDKGEHLTAATTSSEDQYTVIFFASQTPIPINNDQLNDGDARQIARLTVQQYDTQEQANEEIAYEDFEQNGGNEVDLGHDITGYQDAGAGSLWTGWNEGRWALAAHTQTDQAEAGEKLARNAVTFLEDHSLPIPEEHGFVHLDATGDDQQIIWQKEKVVYQLDQIADPIIGLEIAIKIK